MSFFFFFLSFSTVWGAKCSLLGCFCTALPRDRLSITLSTCSVSVNEVWVSVGGAVFFVSGWQQSGWLSLLMLTTYNTVALCLLIPNKPETKKHQISSRKDKPHAGLKTVKEKVIMKYCARKVWRVNNWKFAIMQSKRYRQAPNLLFFSHHFFFLLSEKPKMKQRLRPSAPQCTHHLTSKFQPSSLQFKFWAKTLGKKKFFFPALNCIFMCQALSLHWENSSKMFKFTFFTVNRAPISDKW